MTNLTRTDERWLAARKWAEATPRSTLLFVVEDAAEFSDQDRLEAARFRLRELGVPFNERCVHDFQWHPASDDFGVCSKCGHEADAAARLLRDGPKSQITSATGVRSGTVDYDAHERPGFIDASRQEKDVLVFNVGILGETYRIARDGTLLDGATGERHDA